MSTVTLGVILCRYWKKGAWWVSGGVIGSAGTGSIGFPC